MLSRRAGRVEEESPEHHKSSMLRVGERVLLLALSDDPDKHPLGYLSSKLLTDVEGA